MMLMKTELRRQLVHFSGLLFIVLAQFVAKPVIIFYFFMASVFFIAYSEYIVREQKRLAGLLERMEARFRDFVRTFERKEVERPFMGAFWFYFAGGVSFLVFSHGIASAAMAAMAVGDALSTLAGKRFGRHRTVGSKTLEGSIACFIGSFIGAFFFLQSVYLVLLAAAVATAVELVVGFSRNRYIDDNLLIPVAVGLVLTGISLL